MSRKVSAVFPALLGLASLAAAKILPSLFPERWLLGYFAFLLLVSLLGLVVSAKRFGRIAILGFFVGLFFSFALVEAYSFFQMNSGIGEAGFFDRYWPAIILCSGSSLSALALLSTERAGKILLLCLFSIFFLTGGVIGFLELGLSASCERETILEEKSPDGLLKAIEFSLDCGATTKEVVHLKIVPFFFPFRLIGPGVVFVSAREFRFKWLSPNELAVDGSPSRYVLKKKHLWADVSYGILP